MKFPIISLFIPVAEYPRRFRITSVHEKKQMFKHLQKFGGKYFCPGFQKQAVDFSISILSVQKLRNIAALSASMQEAGPNLPVHSNWVTEFNTHLIMRLAAGDGTGTCALLMITRCCISFIFLDQGKRMSPQPHPPAAELSWSLNFLSQAFSCHPNLKSGHFLHNAIQKQVFIVMYVKRKQSL